MLLAVMDLGSNSFKMTVAQWAPELSSKKPFRVLHKERHPIQLGGSVFAEGRISKDDFKKAMVALRKMQARLSDFGSPILRVVATSAIRDAENGGTFVTTARRDLGVHIEVISGREEASLIAAGLAREYPRVKRGLLVDIGGGSTEIATFGTEAIAKDALCRSFRVGSVRVASRFFSDGAPDLDRARRFIRDCFKGLEPGPIEKLVGSAGTIQSLGEIFAAAGGGATIHRTRLERWIGENFARPAKQLEKRYGLRPSRSRVLVPGALVLAETLAVLKQESIVVTGMTLRDGLMVDLVEHWRHPNEQVLDGDGAALRPTAGLGKAFLNEIETAASRFHVGVGAARHIAQLANSFYLQLRRRPEADLKADTMSEDLRCLTAASFLYYAGRSVSPTGFERHSIYLVEHLEFANLSAGERKIVVAIFGPAAPTEAKRIARLRAIFGLALRLDEIESQNILRAELSLKNDQALIRLTQRGVTRELDTEAIRGQFKYFEQVFGLKVVAFVDATPAGPRPS